jgi:hypothetical protein
VGELKSSDKPFDISKREVWEAWEKVKGNKGAAGVDGCSIADFEKDLKNNLYKVWNRMSSGCYFPPAVRAVEIPKPHGGGTRILGVPTVADRVAQTVVAPRARQSRRVWGWGLCVMVLSGFDRAGTAPMILRFSRPSDHPVEYRARPVIFADQRCPRPAGQQDTIGPARA